MAHTVDAEVPHTFHSGEPALASEVNENFRYLEEKLADIDADCGANQWWGNTLDVQRPAYSYIEASPGQEITINGSVYVIIKLPFIHPLTGEIYAITKPAIKTFPSDDTTGYVVEGFNVQPISYDDCKDLLVNGFAARIYYSPYDNYAYTNRGGVFQNITHYNPSMGVQFGISGVNISTSIRSPENVSKVSQLGPTLPSNYDFTDLLNAEDYSPPDYSTVVNTFDQLLDYVFIEKISDYPVP